MTEDDVLAILDDTGALRSGHFLLSSGKHSATYVEKARVFERPETVMRLAREVAGWYPEVDAVVSPAVGAIPFGFAVALAAGARFLYAERADGRMTFRRGFRLEPGEATIVVEDVVTTGGSAAETEALVRASGARSLGVVALVDRTVAEVPFSFRALARVDAQVYEPDACPLCSSGAAIDAPGSRHVERG